MQHTPPSPRTHSVFIAVAILSIAVVLAKAIIAAPYGLDRLAYADNDDTIRLLRVQDWLSGRSWFDDTFPRLMPPEGLDLHWSRYVDVGIAALLVPLGWILPDAQAASWAVVLWPSLLMVALIAITARTARDVFGPVTGIFAVLAIMTWNLTANNYFLPARIDHHNVQIVLATLTVFTLIAPGHPRRRGLIGGLCAALSLAIGLELLPTLLLAGLVLAIRAALRHDGALVQFQAFAVMLGGAGLVLFAAETPPGVWFVPRCDVLSAPYLGAGLAAAAVALIYTPAERYLDSAVLRLCVMFALCAAGAAAVALIWPECLSGPYGALPDDVKQIIHTRILEAMSVQQRILEGSLPSVSYALPAFAATLAGTALWLFNPGSRSSALVVLLLIGWLGVLGSLSQIRLIMLGVPAYPMLIGFGLARLFHLRKSGIVPALGFLALLTSTLLIQTIVNLPVFESGADTDQPRSARFCRTPDMLRSLSSVPSSVIFTHLDTTAPMLLVTDHKGVTGPYHRSPAAFAGGVLPFEGDDAGLRRALQESGAEYLLLCRDAIYRTEDSIGSRLARGDQVDWLSPVIDGISPDLILLQWVRVP